MNVIMLILVASGGFTIPSLPAETATYEVRVRNNVFHGYEVDRKQDARLGEIITYQYDEPFREGTEVVRPSQQPVATKETRATRESRWVRQFEAKGYRKVLLPDGTEEFILGTELDFAKLALDAAQKVADANPPPPPLPEEPEFDADPDEPIAEVKPPGFIRLWGPEVFLFVFTAAIIAYLVKTFLMKEAESGE